ncbi:MULTISPECIES: [FeFe] hydrogenase H-cluster maturation GTPase HydF [unclassified Sedimentibacter]|uniref:[FeFe] hydrogenase H-cluster maturation GTPase HydF n=1 Tax=unclassified Sedimentibacter TaxID=2649220 RepID=UPI0027E04E0D|nr:[FeFe] hydrogenase H-cluster maturation GTPase HydF [Sedimentibacter sp. MB35-C1]WMJ77442.1 [FeFe] hydrogenase H-cluster maturation GTPase HydF [Sedimentibacter sp. MB35-C1]
MGLNETPAANRIHISFFGKRNAGKSSVMNAVTNQDMAVVSDIKGTTTDPVYKSMELLPLGPVVMIDTPGIDDEGELGALRIKKAQQVLNKTDVAVLVIDAVEGKSEEEEKLILLFKKKNIPYILAYNKADLNKKKESLNENSIYVSAKTRENIEELKEKIGSLVRADDFKLKIVGDILNPLDFAVLVVPIDKAAPKGRLILPQQQTIRDILEANAVSVVVKESEFKKTLENLGRKPKIVITDSQVFERVNAETPEDIYLTSFSILMARYKGVLKTAVNGARAVDLLQDGDIVLISEGCTHHRQCEDIGTVKLPRWIKNRTKKNIDFKFTSGTEFPDDLSSFKLVVHCGGCMINDREMKYRQKCSEDMKVPFTNYGILIAYMQGILERSIAMFPDIDSYM